MPKKPDMKSEPDFRFTAQITNLCSSEWEDNVLFDADDPDFVGNNAGEGRVLAASNGVLRPVCHVEAAAACVLNSLMLKGRWTSSGTHQFVKIIMRYSLVITRQFLSLNLQWLSNGIQGARGLSKQKLSRAAASSAWVYRHGGGGGGGNRFNL